jgi:hypothetical protein
MNRKLALVWGCGVILGVFFANTPGWATTMAFYSDGVIQDGDVYDIVEVYDTPPAQTTVDMTGGDIGEPHYPDSPDSGIFTYDASTLNMSGGDACHLYTHDSSTVNISGGVVEDVYLMFETIVAGYDSSVINVYDGGLIAGAPNLAFFELFDSSELNVYGGTVGPCLCTRDSASVNVYGGKLWNLMISGWSSVNIYGGYIDTFLENDSLPSTAAINFYGWGFEYKAEAVWVHFDDDPPEGWWISKLTGYGFDGNPITYFGLPDPALNPNIRFIPEPSTFLLGVSECLCLIRERKTKRFGRKGGWQYRR